MKSKVHYHFTSEGSPVSLFDHNIHKSASQRPETLTRRSVRRRILQNPADHQRAPRGNQQHNASDTSTCEIKIQGAIQLPLRPAHQL